MTQGWYLARTKSLSEYRAAVALERNGYELYFPRVQTPRPRNGHDDSPLFPGYLFVRQDRDGSGLPAIHLISGLVGWVQFDDVVPKVPDEVIAELKRRLEAINRGGGYWRRFRPGDMVRVVSGSMESLGEVLQEPKSPQSRIRVLLRFMGGLIPAHVPWENLRPVEGSSAPLYVERPPRRTRGRGRWIRGFGPRGGVNSSPPSG